MKLKEDLYFRSQEPETLASAGVHRSLTEKEKDQRSGLFMVLSEMLDK